MRKLRLGLSKRIILVLAVFFSGASVWSAVKERSVSPLEKSKSRMINLEVTHLYHALRWVKWKEHDLPPAKKPIKCLIVGKDPFRFKDRLSFVFAESGNGVFGHPIEFLSFVKMEEALRFSKTDSSVMILVALDSTAEEWASRLYPKRPGFIVYGQSEKFRRKGMTFCSRQEHNRLKLSVNLRRAHASGLSLSSKLLEQKRIFSVDNGTASGPSDKWF